MVDKEYYSGKEIRERFDWSRQSLYATAKREKWRIMDYKRPYSFCKQDVEDYTVSRLHTLQARVQGYSFRGLIRHRQEWSDLCPICNKSNNTTFNTSNNDASAGENDELPLDNTIK